MPQLTYEDQQDKPALEGGLYDSGPHDVVSRSPGGNVKQVATVNLTTAIAAVVQESTLTVTTAADADVFEVRINGVIVAAGTSSGTDKTVQRDAIEALLLLNAYFVANFSVADLSTDALTITALNPGEGFTINLTITATSVWTPAVTVANVVGTQLKFTIAGHELIYACATTGEEVERDAALVVLLADGIFAALVDMVVDDSADPVFGITFTAKTAGVPFTLTFANENSVGDPGDGSAALVATTANVTGSPIPFGRGMARSTVDGIAVLPSATGFVFEGISVNRAKGLPKDTSVSPPITGEPEYGGDEAVPVLRRDRIWVSPEDAVTVESGVFLRHTVEPGDATHTPGRFRGTDAASEVDEITQGARWITSAGADGLAVLEIDVLASATT